MFRGPRIVAALLLGGACVAAEPAPVPADPLEPIRSRMADGAYPEASAAAAELLARLDAAPDRDELALADVLDLLVEARWRSGEVGDETRKLGERALEIKQRRLGPADAGVGKTQHHLAVVAFFNGDYPRAKELWEQATANRETALGADHPDVAESMNGLANLLQTTGDYAESLRLYARAVEIRERAFGPDHPKVAQTLGNLNGLLTVTGDYTEALRVGERALQIRERALGPEHPQVALSLLNLAVTVGGMGNVEAANAMLERAISIWEKALGPEHPSVAAAVNNLGENLARKRRFAEALPYYERARAIWEKASGPTHPNVAIALNNTAQAHAATGHPELALPLQERAFAIFEGALGPDHPDVAESAVRLAALCVDLGDVERAAALYARSVSILRGAFGPDHPFVAEGLDGLARLEARRGNGAKALELALESERIGRDHLRLTGRALAEAEALRYAAVRHSSLDLALSLASRAAEPGTVRSVLDALVRSRAVVLDEMAARHRTAETTGDPKVTALAGALGAARERLANLTVRGLGSLDPAAYRAMLDRARDERDRAERALAAASTRFAAERERSRLGLAEVAAHLPPRSALVAFAVHERLELPLPATAEAAASPRLPPARTERSFVALLVRADGKGPFAAPLGAAEDVESLVAEWKREAAQGMHDFRRERAASEAAYREVGGKLRARVWDPLRKHLDGVERVFVVPDGALNLVSFAALPVEEASFLVESGPLVHYLSAERDLVVDAGATRRGSGLLAVGGPDYDSTLTAVAVPADGTAGVGERTRGAACGSFAALRFDPLPAARQEAQEILDLWNAAEANPREPAAYLSGASATEGGVKAGAAGRRVLHLATHGFFLGGDCAGGRDSRGFKVVQEAAPPEPVIPGQSPLLLSGLAFAGANARASATEGMDDGVLTAEEVAALDLGGVEWAVLSACDTGVGEIRAGEGVFGLRRAMQVAGVHTLIMSLWPVDDEATREWMKALYRGRLEGGLDSAGSVREAGLHVLEQRRAAGTSTHPYYWAAFVAAGDWR